MEEKLNNLDPSPILPGALVADEEVRALCAMDRCGHYGRHHQCPPAVGELAECQARLRRYRRGEILRRTYVVDVREADAVRATQRDFHEVVLAEERTRREAGHADAWGLIGGPCTLCDPCTAEAGEPCADPARARPSLEALGVHVVNLQRAAGWDAAFHEDRVTWTGAVLWDASPDPLDPSRGPAKD